MQEIRSQTSTNEVYILMKRVVFVFFVIILSACSVGNKVKLYDNIVNIGNAFNERNADKVFVSTRKFHPLKTILKQLEYDKKNNQVVVIFSWVNHLPITGVNHFECLIHDLNSNTTYYCNNTPEDYKEIRISKNYNKTFEYHSLFLKHYQMGDLDSLVSQSPVFTSSEDGTYFMLFDTQKQKASSFEWYVPFGMGN